MKVLVEGIGSMVFGSQLKFYRELDWELIGMDVTSHSFGLYKVDRGLLVPKYSDSGCWLKIEEILEKEKINLVMPTVNEGLLTWSMNKKTYKEKYNTDISISDEGVIDICIDKWKTFEFFKHIGIPTPETSLEMKYEFLKPRVGRGSAGIFFKNQIDIKRFNMAGYISQEIVEGDEYTIDVLCDFDSNPIYIIPRKRLETESGVSVKGVTVFDEEIINYTKIIVDALKPIGIINIQCFKNEKDIKFIEINPRLAGGSTLSFASSDNWFKAIECFYNNSVYEKKEVMYDNYMFRYFNDLIINKREMLV
ncbi:ATP-grasp domain-containing protein [Acetobacterium wieringae]|uniref:ATP-grasp domain-containing protein n=1 Tax=Acetobacterium wieringae TaxID=52694 RepID=A0A5D0WP31_9FIRM|nr:ATP-grasp domain-containing protein [Acetobacterium wieringae]TYC85957.1 ATP-grasp domain-containing protein [Acetobacterium wieringae]